MSVQVYREDGEVCIDKGGQRMYLDDDDARDLLRQLVTDEALMTWKD